MADFQNELPWASHLLLINFRSSYIASAYIFTRVLGNLERGVTFAQR
jgi:hypothetical protein